MDQSFNQVDVDGDSSTNDTVVLMANGKSGVEISSQLNTNIFSEAIHLHPVLPDQNHDYAKQ